MTILPLIYFVFSAEIIEEDLIISESKVLALSIKMPLNFPVFPDLPDERTISYHYNRYTDLSLTNALV